MRQYIWALACALLLSGCASKSLEWQQHTEDEFPTRVNWIISQVGNVLDAKRGLRYGTWTITSGEGGPLATYQCPQGGICEINISNLQCQQSTGGPAPCEIVLYKNAICELVIPEKKETLEIGCPISVALKPKGTGEKASPEEAAAVAASAAAAAATAKGAQEAAGVAPAVPKGAQEPAGTAPKAPKEVEAAPTPITPATEAKAAAPPPAPAAASEQAKGRSVGGDFVFGLRAGLIVPTQQILENLSSGTSTGPLVNLEGYYVLREWVRLGLMFEWQRYKINARDAEVGTLTTFSLLPVVELRPTRDLMRNTVGFEWVIPYASLGAGLNVHSFSNGAQLGNDSVSFANTFAFRVAGGFDFPITSNLAVNTEMAWKRDSGNFERNGLNGDFNASSLMFLFGLRVHF
jgi:outer membrane protein